MMRAALLTLVMTIPGAAAATAQPAPTGPVVVVRGEGEVRTAPDVAFVTVAVELRGSTAPAAQTAAATAMTSVRQRLTGAGIAAGAIRTLSYDVQPQFDYTNGKQVPRGFLARNVIEVRLDDIARVGEVLELAISAGGTSVQNVRFDLKQRAAAERDALTRAVADARARAEAAAKGAGATVVAVLRIQEDGAQAIPVEAPMMRMAADSLAAAPPPPPIAAGEVVIHASVTLTASIK